MTQDEIVAFISNPARRIDGDIAWAPARNRPGRYELYRLVEGASPPEVYLAGWFYPASGHLSFTYLVRENPGRSGRIYGLCVGLHHNGVGPVHKHGIRNARMDTYAPADITAPASDPPAVWRQFCAESNLTHRGRLLNLSEEL